ncbi:MAG: hypothetical protein PHY95_03200 [Candidatus ainarchaeum sp.]|nr:hypothetical protein [Candidatus ainarchaeum sp.]
MKKFLLALLLASLSFAAEAEAWQVYSITAVLAAFSVLVIFYMLTYAVDSPQARGMAVSEMFQVLVTLVIIAVFVGAEGYSRDVLAPAFGEDFGAPEGYTHLDFAVNITKSMINYQWGQITKLDGQVVRPLANLATVTGNCGFLGFSFTFNGCAGIAVPSGSMALAMRVLVACILSLSSQLVLLMLANDFFFPVLLPMGLFLRCFHVTRGTGGFLIAVAVAFYFVYPLGVIITKGMLDQAEAGLVAAAGADNYDPVIPSIDAPNADLMSVESLEWIVPGDCDPFDMSYEPTKTMIGKVMNPDLMDRMIFHFFIGGLFTSALNLLIALSSVRELSRIFGTEVDVSALARVS